MLLFIIELICLLVTCGTDCLCYNIYSRRLEHSTLTAVGDRSWLNGFHPEDVDGCVVAAYVREDNTVALLKFQPE